MTQLTLMCNTDENDTLEVVAEHGSISVECCGDNVIVLNEAKAEKLRDWLNEWLNSEQQ